MTSGWIGITISPTRRASSIRRSFSPTTRPSGLADRETLWDEVEATERRKDAQLSREIEFAIPREMSQQQGIELARDFASRKFVDRGMIADLNVHWDIGADGLAKPHAHVVLSIREVSEDGFGTKVRDWNRTVLIEHWRERWADHVNERLAELDIDARVDHRSLEAQGIDLEPQDKIGPAAQRMGERELESERIQDHREIARRNGERIIAEPRVARCDHAQPVARGNCPSRWRAWRKASSATRRWNRCCAHGAASFASAWRRGAGLPATSAPRCRSTESATLG